MAKYGGIMSYSLAIPGIIYITNFAHDQKINEQIFAASYPFSVTHIEANNHFTTSQMVVHIMFANLPSVIGKEVLLYNQQQQIIWRGNIQQIQRGHNDCYLTACCQKRMLEWPATQHFSQTCRTAFAGSKCGINLKQYTYQHKVLWSDGWQIAIDGPLQRPSYRNFQLYYQEQQAIIIGAQQNVLQLSHYILAKEAVTIQATCDKTFSNCKAFGNTCNFRGEPALKS